MCDLCVAWRSDACNRNHDNTFTGTDKLTDTPFTMEFAQQGRISEPLLDPELVQVERTVCARARHIPWTRPCEADSLFVGARRLPRRLPSAMPSSARSTTSANAWWARSSTVSS